MHMNNRLLKGVPPESIGLAKLILFSLHEDLNLINYVEDMRFKDQFTTEVNKVTAILINQGSVSTDYGKTDTRLKLNFPLYAESKEESFDIEELRQLWSHKNIGLAGKMGDPYYIKNLVERLMLERSYSFEQILEAAKKYIQECMSSGRLIRDLQNFLFDGESYFIIGYIDDTPGNDTAMDVL